MPSSLMGWQGWQFNISGLGNVFRCSMVCSKCVLRGCLKGLGKSMTAFRTGEGKLFKAGL